MTLSEIVEAIIEPLTDTCPCEMGIPCPFRDESNEECYCAENCSCSDGLEQAIRNAIAKEK